MKIVVVSDSHGNIANLNLAIGFAKKIKVGAIIHCGDWDNLKAVEEIFKSNMPVYAVLGNADIHPEIKDRLKKYAKEFNEKYLELNLGDKKIGVIHNIKDLITSKKKLDIIFCGHRHYKSESVVNKVKIVSPGALHSIKPSFVVYDTDINRVEFFDL
jgi:putative phosphoesterase